MGRGLTPAGILSPPGRLGSFAAQRKAAHQRDSSASVWRAVILPPPRHLAQHHLDTALHMDTQLATIVAVWLNALTKLKSYYISLALMTFI